MTDPIDELSAEQREDFIERAGIMQYDGEMSHDDAERAALEIVLRASTC